MDLPVAIFSPLLEKLGEPFLLILLIIIWWQFRAIGIKDKTIAGFHQEVKACGISLANLTTLIEVLVHGRAYDRKIQNTNGPG